METIITKEKGNKRKGYPKYCSKTMCTHSKWANEQMLKTELGILPVPNDKLSYIFKCMHDFIQVKQKYAACRKK